jgi:hypothetical protein
LITYVVLAADLDTVADSPKATVGEGSAGDIVLLVALVVTAVERLAVTTLDLLVVVVIVVGGGAVGLGRLGVLLRLGGLGHGKGAGGESEDGDSEELHNEGLKSVCLERRVLRSRAEDAVVEGVS